MRISAWCATWLVLQATPVLAGQGASAVPSPWVAQDVGAPSPAGSTTFTDGSFVVQAGGLDIWDETDQFHFVAQVVAGDVDIVARVDDVGQAAPYAKAGVMIRSALSGDAANAFAELSPDDGQTFQWRPSAHGSTEINWGEGFEVPLWLRLVRSGSTVTAYSSADGKAWETIDSETIPLGPVVYVGLAVTSRAPGRLARASFSHVVVSQGAASPGVNLIAPSTGSSFVAPATIPLVASVSPLPSSLARVDFYNDSALIGSAVSAPYAMTWPSVPAGLYALHATAVDAGGTSASSATVTVTVDDVATGPSPTPAPAPVPASGSQPGPDALYISPGGDDRNPGTATSPVKTFATAFGRLKPGGELVLLDGIYGEAAGTGYINYQGTNSAQIPSGTALAPTYVHALNPGAVKVNGQLFIGRSSRKDSYIVIDGIAFEGGNTDSAAALYNTSFITIRNGGFHSTVNDGGAVFDVGTNDGRWGNTDNLLEDLWIWGQARGILVNYRADRNVWRRIVVRGDGCSSADCSGSGNPNIGTTVYDSQGVTLENVIVLDRVLVGSRNNYADFAVAQHTPGLAGGHNQWLGTISINAPDNGYYFEPDQQTLSPANTLRDVVAWNSTDDAVSLARSGLDIVENATLKSRGASALYMSRLAAGSYANNILALAGPISGSVQPTGLSRSDPSMMYPLRSALGATIEFRYVNGVLTTEPLWPWPNESRIKSDMCAGVSRGFCGDTSLTHYIWNQMGNGSPY